MLRQAQQPREIEERREKMGREKTGREENRRIS
jgi:hypothetical protein